MKQDQEFIATTRRVAEPPARFYDLSFSDPGGLPEVGIVYIVAAIPKFAGACADEAWAVNVDGPIRVAKRFRGRSIVFVSSDAVERYNTETYGRQKAFAESFMHTVDAAIVRPCPLTADNVDKCAEFIVKIGTEGRQGIFRWP
jgi:dTDP-4-dehydrorhamnose reductase